MADILMDPNQFQAAILAWGSVATVSIAVIAGVVIAVIKAIGSVRDAVAAATTAIAAVSTTVQHHETALNGALTPRIEAIADQRIAAHRRPGDVAAPVGPTAAPSA